VNGRRNPDTWSLHGYLSRPHDATTAAMLRASDEDREQTATRLRHAAAEGRLRAEELEARLEVAFAARTYSELEGLVSDLPRTMAHDRPRLIRRVRLRREIALAAALIVALVLIAGALGLGIRRSSAAAPNQPLPPVISHVGPR
jgi:Domain of unknown function (DUF1707)